MNTLLVVMGIFFFSMVYSEPIIEKKVGKDIFIEKKWNMCHSYISQKVESKKSTPIDLSKGLVFKDTTELSKFLKKEIGIDGKLHPIKYSGTNEDLQVLTKWIVDFQIKK